MLVDYISPDKLPHVIVWIDWNLYAWWRSLIVCIVIMNIHYAYDCIKWTGEWNMGGAGVATFVGCCLWYVYIAASEGYGVG